LTLTIGWTAWLATLAFTLGMESSVVSTRTTLIEQQQQLPQIVQPFPKHPLPFSPLEAPSEPQMADRQKRAPTRAQRPARRPSALAYGVEQILVSNMMMPAMIAIAKKSLHRKHNNVNQYTVQ